MPKKGIKDETESEYETETESTSESGSDIEDVDEETVEDEETPTKRKRRATGKVKPAIPRKAPPKRKTPAARPLTPSTKTSKSSTKKKNDDVTMDLSTPDKTDAVIPIFSCKIGGDWLVRAEQYTAHGSPFLQIQKVEENLVKKFQVQIPIDKAQKLVKAVNEAAKHCAKHKN